MYKYFKKIGKISFVTLFLFNLIFMWLVFAGFSVDTDINKQVDNLSKDLMKNLGEEITEMEELSYNGVGQNNLKILYNINGEPEYLNVDYVSGGYGIYNRLTGTLLECNQFAESPFESNNKYYYIGPVEYAVETKDGIVNIRTGKQLEKIEKESILVNQQNIRKEIISDAYNTAATKQSRIESSSPIWGNVQPFLNIDLRNFTNVPQYGAIATWQDAQDFGKNENGTCQMVALSILLRYADVRFGGVIPEMAPEKWETLTKNRLYKCKKIGKDEYRKFPVVSAEGYKYQNLHNYLLALSKVSDISDGISDATTANAISFYRNEVNDLGCVDINPKFWGNEVFDTNDKVFDKIKQLIDTGYPTAVSIKYRESAGTSNNKYHKVVAYGYYINNGEHYIRVHMGWSNADTNYTDVSFSQYRNSSYSSVILNKAYINTTLFSKLITLEPEIKTERHSFIENNRQAHRCDNVNCYANLAKHEYVFSIQDANVHECICGMRTNHFTMPYTLASNDMYLCIPQLLEKHMCYCGDYFEHNYEMDDANYHRCKLCIYGKNSDNKQRHEWVFMNSGDKNRHFCYTCAGNGTCFSSGKGTQIIYNEDGIPNDEYHIQKCERCNGDAWFYHLGKTTSISTEQHKVQCSVCGLNNLFNHKFRIKQYDQSVHSVRCVCGLGHPNGEFQAHTFKSHLIFLQKCTSCGYVK